MAALIGGLVGRRGSGRPGRALVYPAAQKPDLFGRQPVAARWHYGIGLSTAYELDHTTGGAVARNNRRPVLASFERALFHVPPQVRFLFVAAMTGIIARRKDRLD